MLPLAPRLPNGGPRIPRARQNRRIAIVKERRREKLQRFMAAGTGALPIFSGRAWERLRYKGMKLRDWLVQSRPESHRPPTRIIADLEWSAFKKFCAADGNWLPWLAFHLEPQYTGMFERKRPRRPKGTDPFEDMLEPFQSKARIIFARLCKRWAWSLSSSRKAILVGRARWLATHPRIQNGDEACGPNVVAMPSKRNTANKDTTRLAWSCQTRATSPDETSLAQLSQFLRLE